MKKENIQEKPSPITGSVKIWKIKKFIKEKGITKQQFAEKCKIELNQLNKVLDDYSLFEPIWLLKIARAMGTKFEDLVN